MDGKTLKAVLEAIPMMAQCGVTSFRCGDIEVVLCGKRCDKTCANKAQEIDDLTILEDGVIGENTANAATVESDEDEAGQHASGTLEREQEPVDWDTAHLD